jgi:hypothetical protein
VRGVVARWGSTSWTEIWLSERHGDQGLGRLGSVGHVAESVEILSECHEDLVVFIYFANGSNCLGVRAGATILVIARVDVVGEFLEFICGLSKLE